MKPGYRREIFMDGTVKIVNGDGKIIPEDLAFWVENGKDFTPIPIKPEPQIVEEVPFTFHTFRGLFYSLCITYFVWNYGWALAFNPEFIVAKAEAVQQGRNYFGYIPGQCQPAALGNSEKDMSMKTFNPATGTWK